jgi:hypothetical protein
VSLGADALAVALGPALRALLPAPVVDAPALAVQGERLYVRGVVDRRALAGVGALPSLLGGVLEGRDTLLLDGGLSLVRPGVAAYRVRAIRLGRVTVPDPLHPALLARLGGDAPGVAGDTTGARPLPEDALALPVPATVADLRIVDGRVVFDRAVPR